MKTIYIAVTLFSAISFIFYGSLLLGSPRMQAEFKRFRLSQFTKLVGVLELLGGLGLFIGLNYRPILLISSGGLAALMCLGFLARMKVGDGLWLALPAIFFWGLNTLIFFNAL